MDRIDRREFLGRTAGVVAAVWGSRVLGAEATRPAATTQPARKVLLKVGDTVILGRTGIKTSRLAIGTGTESGGEQRGQGIDGMVRLFRHGFDQGVRWWESADMYKTHPHLRAALKDIKRRDQIVVTTKTQAKDAAGVRADLERFRKELDTDYIDIVLLHCMTDANWPEKMKGPMDVLSEAKQKGWVRAVGCSCHTLEALQAAANEPWVDVDLARFNPFAAIMDVGRAEEVYKVERVLESMHQRGKAVYAMKIIGAGTLKGGDIDESLKFALSKRFISGFTIGFSRTKQIDDIAQRIDRLRVWG